MATPPEGEKRKEPPTNSYTFQNFMKAPTLVLQVIGLIFWPKTSYRDYKWSMVNFLFSLLAIVVSVVCQFLYSYKFQLIQFSKSMMEGTAFIVYISYTLLCEIKVLCLYRNLFRINKLLSTLNGLFPVTENRMAAYNLKEYRQKMLLLTIPVAFVIWFNACFYTVSSVYMYLFTFDHTNGDLNTILQFYFWYPFEINSAFRFFIAFVQQFHVSQVVSLCVLGIDALLTCILLQICMHLDALSMRLKKRHSLNGDIKDLVFIVHYHDLVLQLMDEVNVIFSMLVFITFLSSSVVICFVGFQVTNGTNNLDIARFMLFLLYELLMVFQTCLLGDMLMESIMSKSYTFFTLLHTMYNT